MRKLGDKIGAKLIAEEAGVPVAPWSRGEVASLDAALRAADEIGYPLMLKAAAGGGGRGIRVITSPGDLTEAFERTSAEALRAFGSGTVLLERLVTGALHVEVQVIAAGQGTAWAVTELITGIDLVRLQLHVADGGRSAAIREFWHSTGFTGRPRGNSDAHHPPWDGPQPEPVQDEWFRKFGRDKRITTDCTLLHRPIFSVPDMKRKAPGYPSPRVSFPRRTR